MAKYHVCYFQLQLRVDDKKVWNELINYMHYTKCKKRYVEEIRYVNKAHIGK